MAGKDTDRKACIIMPCYNAAPHLEHCLAKIPSNVFDLIETIICVDDGSIDETAAVLIRAAEKYPLTICTHTHNRGYGAAQKTAIAKSLEIGSDLVVMVHADGQMDASFVPVLLREIHLGNDMVSGSRLLDGKLAEGRMPFYKQLGHLLSAWTMNVVLRTNFKGYSDGFMAYRTDFLKAIGYRSLNDTFLFDAEIFIIAHIHGFRWSQVPVPTIYGDEESNLKSIRYGLGLLGLLWKYIRGHYRSNLLCKFESQT